MREIVVFWRDLESKEGESKRVYWSEIRLCTANLSLNVYYTREGYPEPDRSTLGSLTTVARELLRPLHISGVISLMFANQYMLTVGIFATLPGAFTWEPTIQAGVVEAFQMAYATLGDVRVTFRHFPAEEAGTATAPAIAAIPDAAALDSLAAMSLAPDQIPSHERLDENDRNVGDPEAT